MSPKHSLADVEPTLRNRFDQHVKDVAIAVISVGLGGLVFMGEVLDESLSNMPVSQMPATVVYAMGALVAAGGILSLVGLLVTRNLIDKEYRTERTGEIFLFFGWSSYVAATTYYTDNEMGSLVFGSVIAVACAWRWYVVGRIERHERLKLELEKRAARGRAS